MQIDDLLARTGALQAISRELGLSETETANGAVALAPAILGGFRKQAQSQPAEGDALGGLGALLGRLGGGSLLDDVLAPQPTHVDRGNDVLGQIFGSKDVSRAVAQNASSQSGLDPSILKKMLPMLAMLLTGYLAKQGNAGVPSAGGGLGGLLGGLLGSRATGGGGGASSPLDSLFGSSGDGNPLDDILRTLGKR